MRIVTVHMLETAVFSHPAGFKSVLRICAKKLAGQPACSNTSTCYVLRNCQQSQRQLTPRGFDTVVQSNGRFDFLLVKPYISEHVSSGRGSDCHTWHDLPRTIIKTSLAFSLSAQPLPHRSRQTMATQSFDVASTVLATHLCVSCSRRQHRCTSRDAATQKVCETS